jgi:flagellar hook-basal body protein
MENSADDVDVAITGTGFLIVKDPLNQNVSYTRDGNFSINNDGYLINAHGYRVQGKAIDPTTGTPAGVDGDIVLSQSYSAPKASTSVDMVMNLDANAAVGDHYDSAITVYDNLGNAHTLDMTYTNAAANSWGVTGTLDGTDISGNITDQGGRRAHHYGLQCQRHHDCGRVVRRGLERFQYRRHQPEPHRHCGGQHHPICGFFGNQLRLPGRLWPGLPPAHLHQQ